VTCPLDVTVDSIILTSLLILTLKYK
jgi:hypothetical protein